MTFADEGKALSAIAREVDHNMGGRGVLNEMVKRIIDPLAGFLFLDEEDTSLYAGKTIVIHQVGDTAQFVFQLA